MNIFTAYEIFFLEILSVTNSSKKKVKFRLDNVREKKNRLTNIKEKNNRK